MKKIKTINKRQLFLTLCLVIGLGSCSVNQRELDKNAIDVEFDRALNLLHEQWPESQKLTNDACGDGNGRGNGNGAVNDRDGGARTKSRRSQRRRHRRSRGRRPITETIMVMVTV